MQLNIKDSLSKVKIYGRYLSEFLLPDQVDILAKSLQKDIEQKLTLTDVVSSNRYKTDEYLVYTPSDDESVVVIEDTFKTQKTVDIKDFNNLMSVLHSVQDY